MIEELLKINKFIYEIDDLNKLKDKEYNFSPQYYKTYIEFLLLDKINNIYCFIIRNHKTIKILLLEEYYEKFFLINIENINNLLLFYKLFNFKIIKLKSSISSLKIENVNEIFRNNVFKIMDNYEILINVKFHDNLNTFIEIDDIINYFYELKDIIEFKSLTN